MSSVPHDLGRSSHTYILAHSMLWSTILLLPTSDIHNAHNTIEIQKKISLRRQNNNNNNNEYPTKKLSSVKEISSKEEPGFIY